MEQKRNFQLELEKLLKSIETCEKVPTLLLHSCCAPCSSYVLEYLAAFFDITVLYYNPNISSSEEYLKRMEEEKRLIGIYNEEKKGHAIKMMDVDHEPSVFYETVKGLEQCKEGGERCFACYELRLQKTVELAKKNGFDYFGTTLTISPLKNAQKLNEIGERLGKLHQVKWLYSDFKKKGGYLRSIELSEKYGLYRQDFCGCSFSKTEREEQKRLRQEQQLQEQL